MILNHPLKTEQAITAVAMAALLVFGFYMTDMHMAAQAAMGRPFWRPALSWDLRIPFEPSWIWIYLLYFPMCFIPLLFKEIREDISVFRRTAAGFALQFIVALVFFWALPSQMIRPDIQPGGISERVLASFYEIDPGFNIFPSLHVANAAYIACMTNRFEGKLLGASMWLLCGLIALSTLFVKQHYLSDLPAGLGLGVTAYKLVFSRPFDFLDPCRACNDWTGPNHERRSCQLHKNIAVAQCPGRSNAHMLPHESSSPRRVQDWMATMLRRVLS